MGKTDLITTFLDRKLITAPSTRRNYRMNVQSYFKILEKDMDHYFKNGYTNDDYDNDLRKVYKIQQDRGRPDLSTRTYFNSIKQFMVTNDKTLKDLEFWDILKARTRGAEPDSDEAKLNQQDIKTILSHGNAKSRALFLMLASSGRRIGEILALTPDDINTNVHPTTINIRKGLERKTTKTKQKTICYISDEATEAYKTWMKERDRYLASAMRKSHLIKKDGNDPRVFPMSYHNALVIWKVLLMDAKVVEIEPFLDKWTGQMNRRVKKKHKGDRILMHPHCLRKFFRSYLGDADFSEYLMGHATIMTRTYRQMKDEDKAAKYQELMSNVTIFETPVNLSGVHNEIKELKDENQRLRNYLQDMDQELKKLLRQDDQKYKK
jgi:integrase